MALGCVLFWRYMVCVWKHQAFRPFLSPVMGVHVYTRPTNPHTQLCLHVALVSSLVSPGSHRQPGPVSAALRHRLYTGRCSLAVAHWPLLTDHVSTAATACTPAAAHWPLLTGRCSPTTSALQPPPLHRPLFTGRCSPAAAHRPRQHCSRGSPTTSALKVERGDRVAM